MVVRTQSDGRTVTGLYIGPRNARRNFPRRFGSIELEIGHLHIHCKLPPEFWHGKPEICDRRLSDWLEAKIFHGRSCRMPLPIAMIRTGGNTFRLRPFRLPPASIHQLVRIGSPPPQRTRREADRKACGTVCRPRMFIGCEENLPERTTDW